MVKLGTFEEHMQTGEQNWEIIWQKMVNNFGLWGNYVENCGNETNSLETCGRVGNHSIKLVKHWKIRWQVERCF